MWRAPRARLWGLTWAARPHPQPQTPHLEEDLKEVLRSEAGIELIIEDEARPEKQKRKAGVSGQWGWRSPSCQAGQTGPGEAEPWGGECRGGGAAAHDLRSTEWASAKPTEAGSWCSGPFTFSELGP